MRCKKILNKTLGLSHQSPQIVPLPVRPLLVPPELFVRRPQLGVGVAQLQEIVLQVCNLPLCVLLKYKGWALTVILVAFIFLPTLPTILTGQ